MLPGFSCIYLAYINVTQFPEGENWRNAHAITNTIVWNYYKLNIFHVSILVLILYFLAMKVILDVTDFSPEFLSYIDFEILN